MRKVKVLKTEVTRNITCELSVKSIGKIIVTEVYTDDKLVKQYFEPKVPFHLAHHPEFMSFVYYGRQIDFMTESESFFDEKFKQVFVKNISTFNKFDQLYCNRFTTGNNVYSLTNKLPLQYPKKHRLEGFKYDLKRSKKHLEQLHNVTNVKAWKSPQYLGGEQSLTFNYVPSPELLEKTAKRIGSSFSDFEVREFLGLEKFRFLTEGLHCDTSAFD